MITFRGERCSDPSRWFGVEDRTVDVADVTVVVAVAMLEVPVER